MDNIEGSEPDRILPRALAVSSDLARDAANGVLSVGSTTLCSLKGKEDSEDE